MKLPEDSKVVLLLRDLLKLAKVIPVSAVSALTHHTPTGISRPGKLMPSDCKEEDRETTPSNPGRDNLGWKMEGNGAIYRTIDGGGKWCQVAKVDGAGTPPIRRFLAFRSSSEGFLVARNGKLYRTTDSGRTWRILLPDRLFVHVSVTPGGHIQLISPGEAGSAYSQERVVVSLQATDSPGRK